MRRLAPLLLPCALLALACEKTTSTALDAGPTPPPNVTSVLPASGPAAGGTTVSVWGDDFVSGATVYFGGAPLTQVTFIGPKRVTGKTTASSVNGPVEVKVVNPDGQSATLKDGFDYIPPPSERTTVDSCKLVTQTATAGSDSISTDIVGQVTAVGVTDQSGQGGGITGELGYGAMDAGVDAWTWVPASYADSQSGPRSDGYHGAFSKPAIGTYHFGFRFQYDGGTWTYCDLDGSDNGFSTERAGVMTAHGPSVDWCNLQWPPEAISQPGQPITLPDGGTTSDLGDGFVFGHVYKTGVTEAEGASPEIIAQFGFGPATDGGVTSPGWTWVDADYNDNCGSCNSGHDDEYMSQFLGPATSGDYYYAYRFRVDVDGGAWTYCGNGNPLSSSTQTTTLGILHASGAPPKQTQVAWCNIQAPTSMSAVSGQPTPSVYSHVYLKGVTDEVGQGAGITAELGYGPQGTGPLDSSWSWKNASYNPSCTTCGSDNQSPGNSNDEYFASFSAPAAGSYAYGYRYQYQGGAYVYCGLTGVSDGGAGDLGALTVGTVSSTCRLSGISAGEVSSGAPVILTGAVEDAGTGLLAQVGVGAWGQTPSADWGWQPAGMQSPGPSGSTLYTATVRPAYTGDRQAGFRISTDDGATWSYCDSSPAPDGGYLRVDDFAADAGIGYCDLQWPSTADAGTVIFGQVYAAGITDVASPDAGSFVAELGYGNPSEDPGVSSTWTWMPAGFHLKSGNNLEYQLAFPALDAGTYHYAYRFSLTGSAAPYCYGDFGGSLGTGKGDTDGFSGDQMGTATLP